MTPHGPLERGYEPVTFTTQVQEAGACTTSVCAPRVDSAVTDCPDGPVSLMAADPLGADPLGVTNTWNEEPAAGAGAHLNAHPMFHPAAVVVNGGLVQFPWSCGDVKRTRAGPAAVVDEVEGAVDVVVEPPAAAAVVVVAELPPAAVVVAVLPPAAAPVEPAL